MRIASPVAGKFIPVLSGVTALLFLEGSPVGGSWKKNIAAWAGLAMIVARAENPRTEMLAITPLTMKELSFIILLLILSDGHMGIENSRSVKPTVLTS
jgi:hypothetical protein